MGTWFFLYSITPIYEWEFQDPKIEVRFFSKPYLESYFVGIFPDI